MKIIFWLQRLLLIFAGIYGVLLIISEVPVNESWIEQLKVFSSGVLILLLCVGWACLIDWEEDKLSETR